jgi:hypothetical protein
VARELGIATLPKPIASPINYLRSGHALDSFRGCLDRPAGPADRRRLGEVRQEDATKPIATAFGHFKLRQMTNKE